jgi:predicted nucleotidyltransferase
VHAVLVPEITPKTAAAALLARAARQAEALDARRRALRARLPQLAAMLRSRYGAQRVILFGSLAWGGFHSASDVDVAVTGVEPDRLWQATIDANLDMPVPVELFALERLPPAFRARVQAEGEPLA